MNKQSFFCKRCEAFFDTPKYYYESHGLDNPPYEKIYICPTCNGDEFLRFDMMFEKLEIVDRLLLAVMYLNKHIDKVKEIFGLEIKNCDLSSGVEIIAELIFELFDFVDVDMQRKILNISDEQQMGICLKYLRGGI